MSPQYGELTAH